MSELMAERTKGTVASTLPLSAEEIELINAHGPYNHSVWRGRGHTFSHEEGLAGRVEFLSTRIREAIRKEFTNEQLAQMSIADVGCYDGWMLESLSDLPFARMVGIEPRAENIARGRRVREILGISSRVHYQTGEVDTLDSSEPFDIVLCLGVLHHLESIHVGLQKLRSICRRMLVTETLSIPSRHLTPELKVDAELKDMVYRYKPAVFGLTVQKYEGRYYPGSGVRFGVVNVPTLESVVMHLETTGFRDVKVIADWNAYRLAMPRNHRPINTICLAALVSSDESSDRDSQEARWIMDYESRMASLVLPEKLIGPLHNVICANGSYHSTSFGGWALYLSLKGSAWIRGMAHRFVPRLASDASRREILMSLQHCPVDKVRLEYGKLLLARGDTERAIVELQQITRRPNADWRACYRAFYLLWRAAILKKDTQAADRFRSYCLECNPNYPPSLFDQPPAFQN